MKNLFKPLLLSALSVLVAASITLAQGSSPDSPWTEAKISHATIHYTQADESIIGPVSAMLKNGEGKVVEFFGAPFDTDYAVYVYPDRKALDHQWQQAWGDTSFHSECWMVASGVADRLDIVSPRIWQGEHCEHDFADSSASAALLTHELVHVYHGQHNPRKQFDGLDSLSWYVEGLATYASGQLDETRLKGVRDNIAAGKAPNHLGNFWKGQAKYGNAGSLVAYIDKKFGRSMLVNLLPQTDQQKMLQMLGTSEPDLISGWQASLPKEFKMIIHH